MTRRKTERGRINSEKEEEKKEEDEDGEEGREGGQRVEEREMLTFYRLLPPRSIYI